MKAFTWLATASLLLLPTETLPAQSITVHPTFKADGLLRNPATGWMLYMQTLNVPTFLPSEQFWSDSKPFLPFVSILYLRCTWAQMEPQEGHYAWQEDANFQALVKGAQERGLKLAFRVIINSRDCLEQATPKWVQDAGAQGTMDLGFTKTPLWSGSPSNPIVRQKLAHFISAFAQEFDDPSRVDFIDGCGLGWWGEMHHPTDSTNTTPDEESRDIFEWSLGTYSNAFHHVLLCLQVSSALALHGKLDAEGYQKYGYVGRIDNVGSAKWFTPERQQMIQVLFPTTPFLGEVCYFPKDPAKARPILETAFHEGIENHADVLSLRQPEVWLAAGHDLVQAFIAQGGYRLYPSEVIYPSHFPTTGTVPITHTWQNAGAGVFPNDNVRWAKKYRVAFALLDASSKVVATALDGQADPGTWIAGTPAANSFNASFSPAPAAGSYRLALALVDTSAGSKPGIQLAVSDLPVTDGWTVLGDVKVGP